MIPLVGVEAYQALVASLQAHKCKLEVWNKYGPCVLSRPSDNQKFLVTKYPVGQVASLIDVQGRENDLREDILEWTPY